MAVPDAFTDRRLAVAWPKLLSWRKLNPHRAVNRDIAVLIPWFGPVNGVASGPAGEQLDYAYAGGRGFKDGVAAPTYTAVGSNLSPFRQWGQRFDFQDGVGRLDMASTVDFGHLPVPLALPQPGSPYTVYWFSRWTKDSSNGVFGWSSDPWSEYVWCYTSTSSLTYTEDDGTTSRSYSTMRSGENDWPNTGEHFAFFIRSDSQHCQFIAEHRTLFASGPAPGVAPLTPTAASLACFSLNAVCVGTTRFVVGQFRPYIFGVWNRQLDDDEIRQLTEDPFLPIRPDGPDPLELARRELPCPALPVIRIQEPAHDQSPGEGGVSPVLGSYAHRRPGELVEFPLQRLNDAERLELETEYDDGRGLGNPFRFTIPGDPVPELVVFAEPIRQPHYSASSSGTVVKLRVVSPADWHPTPSILETVSAQGSTSQLNSPSFTVEAGDALVYVGYCHRSGGNTYVSAWRWMADAGSSTPEVQEPTPPTIPLRHTALGINLDPTPGTNVVRQTHIGSPPDWAVVGVLRCRNVIAVNATAAGVAGNGQTRTPTVTVTPTVPGSLVVLGAHSYLDDPTQLLHADLPLARHFREIQDVTPDVNVIGATRVQRRAAETTYQLRIDTGNGFVFIGTVILAMSLTPAQRGP